MLDHPVMNELQRLLETFSGLDELTNQSSTDAALRASECFNEFSEGFSRACDQCNGTGQPQSFQLCEAVQQRLLPILLQSRVGRHAFNKPLGYAGDYSLIQHLYDAQPEGIAELGTIADHCLLHTSASKAVRNRRNVMKPYILQALSSDERERSSILSLACGPAAEVFDVLLDQKLQDRFEFHLVDIDPRALNFVREKADVSGIASSLHLHRQDINRFVVGGVDRSGLPPIDLVYSIGLIDYFEDRHVIRLMNFAHDHLKPGGRLVLGNFHPRNPTRALLDHVLDWKLIHRDEAQMNEICKSSVFGRPFDSIEFEPEGVNLFATVEKKTGGSASRMSDAV